MKFSIRFADKIVGTLVILALAVLVFVVFMIGKEHRWFIKDPEFFTYLDSASGISQNMAVQYRGFTIGHVKNVSLDGNRVKVVFSIFDKEKERVTKNSLIELQSSLIPGLGNTFILHPGPMGKGSQEEGSLIPEINSAEGKLMLSSGETSIIPPDNSINNILSQVNILLEAVNEESVVEKISSISERMDKILEDIEKITDKAKDPNGIVMSIIDGQGSANRSIDSILKSVNEILLPGGTVITGIEKTLVSLSGIINTLDETAEVIPEKLPQILMLINEIDSIIKTVQEVLDAVSDNPINFIRSGIPERREIGPGGTNPRDLEF